MSLRTFVVLFVSLLIFVVLQISIFTFFYVTPDETPSVWIFVFICLLMMLLSFGIGVLAIIYERPIKRAYSIDILSGFLVLISVISLFQEGSKWSQIALLFLFVPSMYAGQWYRRKLR